MSHVITRACCNDAGCVAACPVNCIHPTPDEEDFATAEMLYVDPATCIDCGACVAECPVDAIVPETQLAADQTRFLRINAAYYTDHDVRAGLVPFRPRPPAQVDRAVRVAVVGAGPAGLYTAMELLTEPNVHVDVLDRLPTPLGLIRSGVAPDHASTKKVAATLESVASTPRFRYLLGVDVGSHVSAADLATAYTAVVYAHGAAAPKPLGCPGEDYPGSISATEFVAWYNGHPDYAEQRFDLSGERAVIIGNGNVALDIARVLLTDPVDLARTDIADHALEALRHSAIREVVLVARRGPTEAAYTIGELTSLADLRAVDVVVDGQLPSGSEATALDAITATKVEILRELATQSSSPHRRRLVFRFHTQPLAVLGDPSTGVSGLEVTGSRPPESAEDRQTEQIPTELLIRSIGYTGRPLDGLPFDSAGGIVPHRAGRVIDPATDAVVTGRYVAGWIKRGSRGGIGANRRCGEETARSVIDDLAAGRLARPDVEVDIAELAVRRGATVVDGAGWRHIDAVERAAGAGTGRPRVKLTGFDALLAAADLRDGE